MSQWGSCKSRVLLRALNRIGWTLKRDAKGSHRILAKEGWPDVIFAFHDGEEVGPRMLARVAKQTGLKPEDL
jgi:predicted RNA binding protein YcfA (HicA-like mRNA interferase family)